MQKFLSLLGNRTQRTVNKGKGDLCVRVRQSAFNFPPSTHTLGHDRPIWNPLYTLILDEVWVEGQTDPSVCWYTDIQYVADMGLSLKGYSNRSLPFEYRDVCGVRKVWSCIKTCIGTFQTTAVQSSALYVTKSYRFAKIWPPCWLCSPQSQK